MAIDWHDRGSYLTIGEAALHLDVSRSTLRNWERDGKLMTERHPLNGYRVFTHEQLDPFVKAAPAKAEPDGKRDQRKSGKDIRIELDD
jgi:hypothetical protein